MEGTLSSLHPLTFISSLSNSSIRLNSLLTNKGNPSRLDNGFSIRAMDSSEKNKRSKPFVFTKRRTLEPNSGISSPRKVSAVRLLRIDQGGAFADRLNEKGRNSRENEMGYVERTLGFRTRDLDDRDIRLVTDIVGGAVRWRRYLDHLILSLCNDENIFRGMEPLLLQILRIGFYEILKLGMPSYAVVDENVKLTKVALRPGAGNMVNGILRKLVLLKEKDSLPLPKLEGDDRAKARALATIYSHPVWMVRRWTKYLGQEEAVRLMNWNNSDPSFSLRANSKKGCTRAELIKRLEILKVPHEPSLHMEDFVRIRTGMQIVVQAGLLNEGLCSVQDESAGLVVSVVDPQPGETIIDCCAAPGGKTLFMALRLRGQGSVAAIDINKGRLRILEETAKLHDVDDVITPVHADLRIFAEESSAKFDKVLLDAPCSGLGVLSKRADLRWNRRLEDMELLQNLQDELLDASSTLVKPGGILVYSTCSIDPEENEERVSSFLLRHPEFRLDPVDRYVPLDFVTQRGFFFSNPVKHSLDGSFAARLVRSLDDSIKTL
ncbi:NOL1/NOP2/sun family protein / antitermination NusB domain-containing protein isoform X2 [Tasmannia lanceolata]|uniref:NOL1/NOP2/sun family protein / antitermination NusB domain-containing protein isoform X2 n=1 Tax=Tasmannia lanceolata TaxID=3420 RepID=UPI0040646DF2